MEWRMEWHKIKYGVVFAAVVVIICCVNTITRLSNRYDSNEETSLELSPETTSGDESKTNDSMLKITLKFDYDVVWLPISSKSVFASTDINSLKLVVERIATQIMNNNHSKILSSVQFCPELMDELVKAKVALDLEIVGAQGKYEKVLNDIVTANGTVTEEQKAELETYIDEIIDCALN